MVKRQTRRFIGVILTLCVFCAAESAFAHAISASYSRIKPDASAVEVQLTLNVLDFHAPDILSAVQENYHIEAPESPASTVVQHYDAIAENVVLLDILYTFNHPVSNLKVTSTLDRITQPDHSHIVQIGEGDDTREAVLSATNPFVDVNLADRTFIAVVWDFVKLGVEHIFTGYDHLAFLAGLLIMTTTLRSLIKVVTSFTAAHSITLALATFNLVSVPSRIIESLIALSIAYIAIENFTGKTVLQRWKITFLFGLVHGFGFSNVLKEMALTRRNLAISLFSFNGGVEIGQLAFVCTVFPLVYYAMKSRWKTYFLTASSMGIAALGLYWFIVRAFTVSGM